MLFSLSIAFIVTAVLVWLCFQVTGNRKEPPGPWGLPVVGYLPFLGRKLHIGLTKLWRKYGDVYQVRIGTRKIVVINGQRAIREALLNKAIDFAGRPDFFSYTMVPNFGFCTYSQQYRFHKKLTLKSFGAFSKERKSELQEVGHKAVGILINGIKNANSEPIEPKPFLYKSACTIMGYICYGQIFDGDSPEVQTILDRASDFGRGVTFGVICDYIPWSKVLIKGKLERFKWLLDRIQDYSDQLFSVYIEPRNSENMKDMTLIEMFQKLSKDTCEINKQDQPFTESEMKTTVSTLFGAGFGTISETIRCGLKLMAIHRTVQKKVQEEIDRTISREHLPEFDDINDMPYTSAVLNEIYRYHSMSALAITHSATCDTELDGYCIAKDTPVVFNLYSAHRDDAVFKNPYAFDPDRFLTPDGQLNSNAVDNVIPYSLGIRRCGGEIIARLEIVLFFVTVMQCCTIEEAPGHPLDPEDCIFTFGVSHNPFKVIFKQRYDGAFERVCIDSK